MEENQNVKSLKEMIEEQIKIIQEEGINIENLDALGKLIDIKKDLCKIEYMKEEAKNMYRENYGNYGRRSRDSRGRYMEGGYSEGGYGNYGRRGVDAKYRESGSSYGAGEEMLDDMYKGYENYRESSNYGAEEDGMRSLNMMLQSAYEFVEHLNEEAKSEQEVQLIKKWTRKMSEI